MEDARIPGAIVLVLGAAAILIGFVFGVSSTTGVLFLAVGAVVALLGAVMVFRVSNSKE